MNYIVTFDEPIPYRVPNISGTMEAVMFSDTDLDKPRHRDEIVIQNVDDVVQAMSILCPEVKSYKIRETLLSSLEDIE